MIQRASDLASYFSSLGLDRSITAIGSLAGAVWGFAFAEAIWPLVWWLAIFVVIDFVTGWVAHQKVVILTPTFSGMASQERFSSLPSAVYRMVWTCSLSRSSGYPFFKAW